MLLELDQQVPAQGDLVLAAAMQLFTAADAVDLAIRLRGVPAPAESDAERLAARCATVCPHPEALPEIVLLAEQEEPDHPVVLTVEQTADVASTARSMILLTAVAQELWAGASTPPSPTRTAAPASPPATAQQAPRPGLVLRDPALGGTGTGGADSLADRLERLTSTARRQATQDSAHSDEQRDTDPDPSAGPRVPAPRPGQEPHATARPLITLREAALTRLAAVDRSRRTRLGTGAPVRAAVLVQHLDSWGALETIARALAAHPRVEADVVALDSALSRHPGETADVLAAAGWTTRDGAWLRAALPDLGVVVLCDGYDEFRPEGLRVPDFAAAGVRLVYSPYGTNIGGEQSQEERQYNGLLHNLAWRVFAPTTGQKDLFAQRCAAGDGHVRAVGSVKRERVLDLLTDPSPGAALRAATGAPRTVLWNPHFTIGEDGWSTFLTLLNPLLSYAASHRDLGLIVRPHFRLLVDLPRIPALAQVHRRFRQACETRRTIVLDDSRDYLAAFAASDAMISDQSSLIPEYLPLRRPVLYLHRPEGAPLNTDATFMAALPAAGTWPQVEAFLDQVRTGNAPVPDAEAVGAEHLGRGDTGAGERAVEAIVTDLFAELGLPEEQGQ